MFVFICWIYFLYIYFEYMSSNKVAEEAEKVIAVNLIGAIHSIAACLPQMKKLEKVRILWILLI